MNETDILKMVKDFHSLVLQTKEMRKQFDDLKVLLTHEKQALNRAIDALCSVSNHPQTPRVVTRMVLEALKDIRAIGKEIVL